MKGKYTRLKLKMLLMVVLGTIIAGAVGIFLLEVVIDGVLQDPFARFFLWASQTLFGQTQEEALNLYQIYIRNNKSEILTVCIMVLMLVAFYLALGRFTHWLEDIRAATRRLVEEQDDPVVLPRELSPIQDDLNAIRVQLAARERSSKEAEQRKGDLVAFLAHDLKTPLTSIISYTELLRQEEDLPAHVKDYILVLYQKALRLQTMVLDVFDVSKAATGNLPVNLRPLDFAKLLRQTLADLDEDIQASGLSIRPALPEEPVWILADGDRLYRVFQNLIGNALKYSLAGSRVYLTLTTQDGRAEATVQNTSRDELPYGVDFTERFVRGDQSRTDGGSGLGLSIARTFTEACNGSFAIRTQADLFTAAVSFPLTDTRPEPEVEA